METFTSHRRHFFIAAITSFAAIITAPALAITEIGNYTVRCAYIIPSDRSQQTNGVEHFENYMILTREWYADQMRRYGYGSIDFRMETEQDGVTPVIHVVNVTPTAASLRGSGGYDLFSNTYSAAATAGVPFGDEEIWVMIPYAHQLNSDGTLDGSAALGGPGACLMGSDILCWDPASTDMTDDTEYDGEVYTPLGPYEMVYETTYAWFVGDDYSGLTSSWLGGIAHEIGHSFGINHAFQSDCIIQGNVMGNGRLGIRGWMYPDEFEYEYCRLLPAGARQISVSPYFTSPAIEQDDNSQPSVSFTTSGSITPQSNGHIRIYFTLSDADGLDFALLYNRYGDVIDFMELSGTYVSTYFETPYWEEDINANYFISAWDDDGNRMHPQTNYTTVNVQTGYNRAPHPTITLSQNTVSVNETVTLHSEWSGDDSDMYWDMEYEWDFNNDGTWDTGVLTSTSTTTSYASPGIYYIRLRVTDTDDDQSVSIAIPIEVLTNDTTPPTPNPATFSSAPDATSSSSITMTATTGSDASGTVEYYFDETSGNPGGSDSGWQSSNTYTDTGLSANTTYTYRVKMRDLYENEGTWSTPASETTDSSSPTTIFEDGFEDDHFTSWDDYGYTSWSRNNDSNFAHTGSYYASANAWQGDLISDTIDTSSYSSMTITFYAIDDDYEVSDFSLQLYNGSGYTTVQDLNLATEDTWTLVTVNLSNSGGEAAYFNSSFRIKFDNELDNWQEHLYLDDVEITAQ